MRIELDACRAALVDMQGRGDARERELREAREGESKMVLRLREVRVAVFLGLFFFLAAASRPTKASRRLRLVVSLSACASVCLRLCLPASLSAYPSGYISVRLCVSPSPCACLCVRVSGEHAHVFRVFLTVVAPGQDVRSAEEERERTLAELREVKTALNASIEAQKR